MPQRSLTDVLRSLRRRVLLIDGAAGVVWGATAALLCLIAGVWIDLVLELSPQWRIGILVAAAIGALAVFFWHTWLGLAKGATGWLARRLDEAGASGGQIVSGIDLAMAGAPLSFSAQPALTNGLAQMAIQR